MISGKKESISELITPVLRSKMEYLMIQILLWLTGETTGAREKIFSAVSWDDSQQIRLNGEWGRCQEGISLADTAISVIVSRKVLYLQSTVKLPEASLVIYRIEDDIEHPKRSYDSVSTSISLNDCRPGIYQLELKGGNGMQLSGKFLLE